MAVGMGAERALERIGAAREALGCPFALIPPRFQHAVYDSYRVRTVRNFDP
jgi:hypothetical protein